MRRLAYPLCFRRASGSGPASGASARMTAVIVDGTVDATIESLAGGQATSTTGWALNDDGSLFFEWGSIDFGAGTTLTFSSIGAGTMLGPAGPDGFSHGTVLWRVTAGAGAFAGASGAIASNFLVNLTTEELIDYQFHVLELP